MFEAEIKFVAGPGFCPRGLALPETTCHDLYLDTPDAALAATGRELRLRRASGRAVLTAKAPPFDTATASKPEYETEVADPEATLALLAALGYRPHIAYAKHCRHFRDTAGGLPLDITLATVDFDPRVFVEIEHLAATMAQARRALPVIRAYAASLGLTQECQTAYTALFLAARPAPPPR
jgi:adenylate cyclase class 2